jgi:hypothetical protein
MKEIGWDKEDFEEVMREMREEIALRGCSSAGHGDECVLCGGNKGYLDPFYCGGCRKEGNYEV